VSPAAPWLQWGKSEGMQGYKDWSEAAQNTLGVTLTALCAKLCLAPRLSKEALSERTANATIH